jgi:hypothetical protein
MSKLIVLLVACLACGVQNAARAQALELQPAFDIGDKWTYHYQDKGNFKEPYLYTHQAYKSEAGSGWLYCETQSPTDSHKQYILRYDYKSGDAKERFRFNPKNPSEPGDEISRRSDDILHFPLAVGKKYNVKWDYPSGKGYYEYKVEVEALEKIQVEAGEFAAYRIKMDGLWQNVVTNGSSGQSQYILWYAPTAKRIVKTDYSENHTQGGFRVSGARPYVSWTLELVKWEPKASLPTGLGSPIAIVPVAPASAAQ